MIDDCQVLGIDLGSDPEIIRRAYRRRAKEVHPDGRSGVSSLERHLLFIQVNQAYRRLLREVPPRGPRSDPAPASPPEGMPVLHGDPAFVQYRAGMRAFMRIHPSQWVGTGSDRGGAAEILDDARREAMRRRVLELSRLFPEAYFRFSLVFHEYPGSPWAADSLGKMRIIEERTGLYLRILESFESWPSVPKEAERRLEGIVARTRSLTEGEERPLRWPD